MTEKQAYKILTNTPIRAKENHVEYSRALEMAVFALGKQIPKKYREYWEGRYNCPTCRADIGHKDERCWHCGQKIDWRNAE